MPLLKRQNASERNGPHLLAGGKPALRWHPSQPSQDDVRRKKRVSKFDEQSHYVIENKESGLRTKPNKANIVGGKACKTGRLVVKPTLQTGPIWQPLKAFDFLTITPQRE